MSSGNYGILCSGSLGLSCLKFIHSQCKVNFVLTDRKSVTIIEYCKEAQIPFFLGNPRTEALGNFLKDFKTDIIFSVNYLFIVEEDLIAHASKFAINLHGSLLPKYRGRTPHVWAIINNEKQAGITAHKMVKGCDEGDIAWQEVIEISDDMTGAGLLEIYTSMYPKIIGELIGQIETGNLLFHPQDNTKATWFGKREPKDGLINWNWQKERLRNWVRAQADPYPGAYTYYKKEKLIIDRIEYSDMGYKDTDPNGLVLETKNGIIIKTSNGAVKLAVYRFGSDENIIKGEILHEGH